MRIAFLLPLAGLAAPAPLGAAKRDPLAGRVAGPPQQCIAADPQRGGTVIDRNTIIYESTGRRYRVSPIGPCPSLRPMTTLITRVFGGQICRNDRFQTIEPGMVVPSAICRFDYFIPYTRPKAKGRSG